VFSYRCMRVARADKTSLPGFDQDAFVPESRANARTLDDVLAEFRAVRGATLALVNSLDEAALAQVGVSSGNPFSARAFCWVIAGHAAHHISLTRERYLPVI
ncbi:MAG: DinB family protein, partial [Gemmatimonadaceae bacterium]